VPIRRRVGKQRRRAWNDEHRHALETGNRYFGIFGDERGPWDMEAAADAWAEMGDEILERWARDRPCLRPWGWWTIVRGMEQPGGASRQRRYLHAAGLLSPAEMALIESDPSLLELKPYGHDWK